MSRAFCVLVCALASLAALPAAAQERPTLSAEARAGLLVMGGARPTGGVTLGAGARYLHPFDGGPWGLYAGAGALATVDSWYWMAVLVAPEAGAWWARGPWHVSAGLGLPAGQLPTCTDWGLCIRSWGLYPEASARVAVRGESVRIGLEASAILVRTLPWSGLGGQVRIVGSYR
ncbi:hypothetical protein [Sorangium sp. So ce1024]|uniref:hypothetical protein n=1 Tax=Sorangium sp. So ce1024 TaxID=3133327 RepID=UPI003F07346A